MISRRRFLRGGALASTGWLGSGAAGCRHASAALSPPEPTANLPLNRAVARAIAAARQANRRFPGMVAGLVRRGGLVGIAADGVRRVGFPDRVEVSDRFHLGSNTKAMTATWVGMAIDAGKLGWDSTLAGVVPDLATRIHPRYRGVTVDQLLSHRAGLPANIAWWGVPEGMTPPSQRRWVLANALSGPPVTAPGAAFGYSNLGFVLAGLLAEEATKIPWEVAIRRFVFDPLGMASAGFGPPGSSQTVREPWGHKPLGADFRPTRDDNPPVMGPAGTVHASVIDWARFAAFHLGDGTVAGKPLVSPPTFGRLHTPAPRADYAGGWLISNRLGRGNGPLYEHAGSNTVWFAIIRLLPRRDFGVVVACNAGGPPGETACTLVADALQALEPSTRP